MIIILSGVGSSGKTTLFNELRKRIPGAVWSNTESATEVIKRRLMAGRYMPWEQPFNPYIWKGFEEEVYNELIKNINKVDVNLETDTLLLDRACEDVLGYCNVANIGRQAWWRNTKDVISYSKCVDNFDTNNVKYYVFLLQPLDLEYNNIRNSDYDRPREHQLLIEAYKQNFTEEEFLIEEKVLTVEQRVQWVLNKCGIKE